MKLQSQKSKQIYSFQELEKFAKQINGTLLMVEYELEGCKKISLQWREYDGCHQKEDREELYIVIED